MVAPSAPGTYTGYWQMKDAKGVPFGQQVSVKIQVPAPPTAVPPRPRPQRQGISFRADSYQLQAGQCTTLHWNVQSVQGVYFYQEGQSWQNNGVTGKEDRQVCPGVSTTYYLRVVFTSGATETQERRINVAAPPPSLPVISRFDANPQGQLVQGQCLDLYWDVQGAVDRVALVRNGAPLRDYAPVAAPTMTVRPTAAATPIGLGVGTGRRPRQAVAGHQRPAANRTCAQSRYPELPRPRRPAYHRTREATAASTGSVCSRTTGSVMSGPWHAVTARSAASRLPATTPPRARYCAITGGQYAPTGNKGGPGRAGHLRHPSQARNGTSGRTTTDSVPDERDNASADEQAVGLRAMVCESPTAQTCRVVLLECGALASVQVY